MSMCRICGDDRATYHPRQLQTLCADCLKGTPAKVTRGEFDRLYWAGSDEPVPESTRRDFYSDYLSSRYTVEQYIQATSEPA